VQQVGALQEGRNTLSAHLSRCVTSRYASADWSSASNGVRLDSASAKIFP
jgi:hypothetical protein